MEAVGDAAVVPGLGTPALPMVPGPETLVLPVWYC